MGFTKPGFAPDEQRVVGTRRRFSNRQDGSVSEPIGSADDERVKCVPSVQTRSTDSCRIVAVGAFSEIGRPTFVRAGEGFVTFIDLVRVGIVGLRNSTVVGLLGSGRSDAHPELDLMSESAAQRIGDLSAQMALDFVLNETARHREQSKLFDDGERLDKI